jgi:prepilin-type N-terminal cleavage/methylation domain-containing protein
MRTSRGFTLIEVMVALVILSFVILGLTTATASFIHVVVLDQQRATAIQLAEGRIDRIQMDPVYANLESAYAGTETTFPGVSGYTRVTTVAHVGGLGQTQDYKVVTVLVTHAALPDSVQRTVIVGAP